MNRGVVCRAYLGEVIDPIRLPVCYHVYCTGYLCHFIFSIAASREGPFPVVVLETITIASSRYH